MMKKIISLALALVLMTVAFVSCGAKSECFTGQWKFSKISNIEIAPEISETRIDELKQEYNAEDEKGIAAGALVEFNADGTFSPCYIRFEKERTYAYDPIMDREATWAFYQTGDNEAFLSVFTDLDAADGNPDPVINPAVVYNADNNTLFLTLKYAAFMVTVEFSR